MKTIMYNQLSSKNPCVEDFIEKKITQKGLAIEEKQVGLINGSFIFTFKVRPLNLKEKVCLLINIE